MELNYEQMKRKFPTKYAFNVLEPDCIREVFETESPLPLFSTPAECVLYLYRLEFERYDGNYIDIENNFLRLINKPLLKKILKPISYITKKSNLEKRIHIEDKKAISKFKKIMELKVSTIDENDLFSVEHPDVCISDKLFLVSLNKSDFGIHSMTVNEVKYYLFNDKEYRISILAKRQPDDEEELIYSLNDETLTNRSYNHFIFKGEEDAKEFLKKHVEEEKAFLSSYSI